jgi:hypothetical protein
MASLASRCSQLSRAMRPYTVALYQCAENYKNSQFVKRELTGLAKAEVSVWRAFLVMCRFNPQQLHRPIESFAKRAAEISIEYDASLNTIAVGVYATNPDTGEKSLLAFTVMDLPFTVTTEARYQNCYKFLAVVLGLLLAMSIGIRNTAGVLWGDSVSSLTWATKDRVASIIARRANIAFTLAAVRADITVDSTVHVPGKRNVVWDGLTRRKTPAEVGLPPKLGIYFDSSHPISKIIALCDPLAPLESSTQHAHLSQQFIVLIDAFISLPIIYPLQTERSPFFAVTESKTSGA